jgi:hypothetical protein
MIELPPLPYGASPAYGYTEAEMRAYGEACARTALEGCAKNCDSIAYELKNPTDPFGSFDAGRRRVGDCRAVRCRHPRAHRPIKSVFFADPKLEPSQ